MTQTAQDPAPVAFDARIAGRQIIASFTAGAALPAPVWCFSLIAPVRLIAGGRWITGTGGYAEIALPDLQAGQTHEVTIAYDGDYTPQNRAWLPLGSYFRLEGGDCLPLPALPQGVIAAAPAEPPSPFKGLALVPQPQTTALDGGVLAATRFQITEESAPLQEVHALAQRCGFGGFLAADGLPLRLITDPALAPEAYELQIAATGVTLTAADAAGRFYGAITLLTLVQTHDGHLPLGRITDAPRFGWRGQHLDCARHFYEVATIERLFDLMALMKLNRFHWHFADDEAFRIEVDCAPALWQETRFRGEGALIPALFGGGIRAGGSYSKADVARLRARAAALQIEIMPEIEVPAHALALTRVFPALRDPEDQGTEVSIQGYRQNALNPAREEVMAFLDPLIAELAEMFGGGTLHLGCDELAPDTWAGSPAAQALCAQEGLSGRDDLQGWFMERVGAMTRRHGLRPAAWEEAAKGGNGGIGHDALLFSWTGQAPGIAAARAGYDVVMCPAQHCYLDMAHSADPADWGAAWAAFIPLPATLDWQVLPAGAEDILPRIKGVQGCFWSEFTTADHQIAPMLAPRILGIALKGWSQEGAVSGADLYGLAASYAPLFAKMDWTAHPAP